jgi:hypothetical protein
MRRSFTAVTWVPIPSGTPNLFNRLRRKRAFVAIHRKYTVFRPNHAYDFALRSSLLRAERLGVGVECHPGCGVTQQFLNDFDILAVGFEERRKRVAKRMPRKLLRDPQLLSAGWM